MAGIPCIETIGRAFGSIQPGFPPGTGRFGVLMPVSPAVHR